MFLGVEALGELDELQEPLASRKSSEVNPCLVMEQVYKMYRDGDCFLLLILAGA